MKSIYATAMVSALVLAAGCKPASAPAPAAPASTEAPAAAAEQLNVSKTVSIDASPDVVWAKVKDFNALNSWHPAVAKDEIVEGKNNEVGAMRQLTLGDGGKIKEKLLAFDDAAHSFQYTILESPLPVADYTSTLAVTADGDAKSTVTWSGTFKHAEKADDKTATDTVGSIYTGGLDNLKKLLEAK